MRGILSSLFFIFLFTLISCTQLNQCPHGLKNRNVQEYYVGSDIVSYFLPDIPDWANFNSRVSCKRTLPVKYVNLKKFRNSFSLSYEKAVQFQYMFNIEYELMKKKFKTGHIFIKDETNLFYDVSDKIRMNIFAFRPPKFKRVHLVWIDPYINDSGKLKDLKRLMKSSIMDKGHPVFVSLCLNHYDYKDFMKKNRFGNQNIRFISYQMFSIYDENNERKNHFSLNFSKLFRKDQELHFFVPLKKLPHEFLGDFILHEY